MLSYIYDKANDWVETIRKFREDKETHPGDKFNPVVGTCSKCGMKLTQCMWYVCSQYPCPTGLGSRAEM